MGNAWEFQLQGSHFFPRTKFPDFSSIFSIFPDFIKYFYGFYSIFIILCMASTYYWVIVLKSLHVLKYSFFTIPRSKNIYLT